MSSATEKRLLVAILAAGASHRLGQPKQLIELGGEPLLRHQCRMAIEADIGPVRVVLGSHANECAASIADLPIEQHINAHWQEGLGASIREAARVAVAADADGLMIVHVDQYRLESGDLRMLHASWLQSDGEKACTSSHDGVSGPPVIFPKSCFSELLLLKGDAGARSVLARLPASELCRLSVPHAFHDLDRPIDLADLQKY